MTKKVLTSSHFINVLLSSKLRGLGSNVILRKSTYQVRGYEFFHLFCLGCHSSLVIQLMEINLN